MTDLVDLERCILLEHIAELRASIEAAEADREAWAISNALNDAVMGRGIGDEVRQLMAEIRARADVNPRIIARIARIERLMNAARPQGERSNGNSTGNDKDAPHTTDR